MSENKPQGVESIRRRWDEHADRYDDWYKTFKGAVEHFVDLELLKRHLPEDRGAKILDAAGGTGRITWPLAKMGYSVTLCDISPKMLDVAKQKLLRGGVLDKVEIVECDVRRLHFADESFDFVLCWDGGMEAMGELIRVTKKGGRISIFLVNKWASAISKFYESPDSSLSLIESRAGCLGDEDGKHWFVSPEEARDLFEAEGIRILDLYAVCGWTKVLGIPEEVLESRHWDETLFEQTTKMLLMLSQEPSVKGMSRHLVLYGEKL